MISIWARLFLGVRSPKMASGCPFKTTKKGYPQKKTHPHTARFGVQAMKALRFPCCHPLPSLNPAPIAPTKINSSPAHERKGKKNEEKSWCLFCVSSALGGPFVPRDFFLSNPEAMAGKGQSLEHVQSLVECLGIRVSFKDPLTCLSPNLKTDPGCLSAFMLQPTGQERHTLF